MRAHIRLSQTQKNDTNLLSQPLSMNEQSFMSKTADESGYDLEPSSVMSGSDSAGHSIVKQKDRG